MVEASGKTAALPPAVLAAASFLSAPEAAFCIRGDGSGARIRTVNLAVNSEPNACSLTATPLDIGGFVWPKWLFKRAI
jgi:hypothetical protein